MNQHERVIVGMSGGVDSSVTALLLKQQGYAVEGLFMKNWEEDDSDTYCSASEDVADAQAVCDQLNIPLHRVNFAAEYWDNVFEHFLAEYKAGRTPNPDILCNREIKFKAFLEYAMHLGADYIATGHYARCQANNGHYHLLKGLDSNKDQSYFLYTLGQKQLSKTLFPVGELEKPQVRQLAAEANFVNHAKKDSTGICFIGERHFKEFLQRYLPAQPGLIKNEQQQTIGEHQGLMFYTIGQRQGLGIGGRKDSGEAAWYVIGKDLANNHLLVGQGENHPALFSSKLIALQLSWIGEQTAYKLADCSAKIRYRQTQQACRVTPLDDGRCQVTFSEAQRAVTPGQSIVFYQDNICLGGGVIQ